MDGYAESMLHDDVSSKEAMEVICPRCELRLDMKTSDAYVKCLRCGEIFYIEAVED